MELLLLLTAFFASLTGAATGDRAGAAQQLQGVTVVRAAQAAQAVVQPVRQAIPAAAVPAAMRSARTVWPLVAVAPLRSVRLVFERRLE